MRSSPSSPTPPGVPEYETWFGSGGVASDALPIEWADVLPAGARVFLNPPYSRSRAFIAKAAARGAPWPVVVALVPARTDTRW